MNITKPNIKQYINKVVKISDIEHIEDTYIILAYTKDLKRDEAILVYADSKQTEEYNRYFNQSNCAITPIYNNSKIRGQLIDD
jgi:hypothetical protein